MKTLSLFLGASFLKALTCRKNYTLFATNESAYIPKALKK
jgi:hypothetical protein